MPRPSRTRPGVTIERPTARVEREFIEAARNSRSLHGAWVAPPSTAIQFRRYLERTRHDNFISVLVLTPDGEMAGVINLSEIVRGVFQSGYLGFYAFTPHAGRGLMRAGLVLLLQRAFRTEKLHRVEANIQPGNTRSIALVKSLGFRREGYSPRYLKLAGRWRDHERWALTAEDWRKFNSASRTRRAGGVHT